MMFVDTGRAKASFLTLIKSLLKDFVYTIDIKVFLFARFLSHFSLYGGRESDHLKLQRYCSW